MLLNWYFVLNLIVRLYLHCEQKLAKVCLCRFLRFCFAAFFPLRFWQP